MYTIKNNYYVSLKNEKNPKFIKNIGYEVLLSGKKLKFGASFTDNAWESYRKEEEEKNSTYVEKRAAMYPNVAEQLDMIYHDMAEGTDIWLKCIKNVKEIYPKK